MFRHRRGLRVRGRDRLGQRERNRLDLDDAFRLTDVHVGPLSVTVSSVLPGDRSSPASVSRLRQSVDRLGVAEVDASVRRRLHRVDAAGRVQHVDGVARHVVASRVQRDAAHHAGVHVAEEQVALDGGAQAASVAERVARDADRAHEPELRLAPRRRTAVVRVPRRVAAAVLARSPAEVPALDDQVDLVVALRTVLRLPQAAGLRVEREPVRVADPEREDPAPGDRVVRRDASGRRHPQDLAPEVAGHVLGVRAVVAVADDRVQHAVGPEHDAPAVVVRAGAGRLRDQHPHAGAAVRTRDLHDLVPQAARRGAGRVHVDRARVRPPGAHRDAEGAALPVAVHAGHREEPAVALGLGVVDVDLPGPALRVDDATVVRGT